MKAGDLFLDFSFFVEVKENVLWITKEFCRGPQDQKKK